SRRGQPSSVLCMGREFSCGRLSDLLGTSPFLAAPEPFEPDPSLSRSPQYSEYHELYGLGAASVQGILSRLKRPQIADREGAVSIRPFCFLVAEVPLDRQRRPPPPRTPPFDSEMAVDSFLPLPAPPPHTGRTHQQPRLSHCGALGKQVPPMDTTQAQCR